MNVVAFAVLLLATAVLAMHAGGEPERMMASVYVLGATATIVAYRALDVRFGVIEPYVAAVDLMVMAGITVVLIRADRFWPIAAFAAQGLAVLGHVVKLIDPTIVPKAYAIALALSGWFAVLTLLVGTLRHVLRVRLHGPQRGWSW